MSTSRAVRFFGLLFVVSTLFDCSVSKVHLTFPKVESPAEMTLLHHGMTLEEVVESIGRPIYDTWVFINKFRQDISVWEFAFYKDDQDRSAGKKTHYRLYFYGGPNDDVKLVHWAIEADFKNDEVILKKTRVK